MHIKVSIDYKWNTGFFKNDIILFVIGYIMSISLGSINFVFGYEIIPYLLAYVLFFVVGIILELLLNKHINGTIKDCFISTLFFVIIVLLSGIILNYLVHNLFQMQIPKTHIMLFFETVVFYHTGTLYTLMLMLGYYICFFIKNKNKKIRK